MYTKLEELKSPTPGPVSEPNPIAEALKANTDAVNALKAKVADLKASATTKEELKQTIKAIEDQSSAFTKIKADLLSEAGKYVSDVATTGYCDASKLKEDIKAMVDRALLVCPPSSSTAEGEVSALATRADFLALGDQYLSNLHSLAHELTTEGNKLRAELL